MAWRIAAVGAVILIVVVYAVGSGVWVSTGSAWYLALEKPWWQPPPWVFGLIWPYNFVVLMVVGGVIAWNGAPSRVLSFLALLAASVIFALAWAYLFYVPHQLTWAAIALTLVAALTIPLTVIAFEEGWWWGVLLVPYQIWLILASSISWSYAVKVG